MSFTGFVCEIAKCLRGTCMNTSSFPFYQCDCDDGWKSPFGSSWLPCIMPNCEYFFITFIITIWYIRGN